MDGDVTKVKLVNESYEESRSAWQGYFTECEEDFRFYLSDQWREEDLAIARAKKAPTLNINYVKKTVDVITGFERQNKTDIKVFPVEGSDDFVAEILSAVVKWITSSDNNDFVKSAAFKDASIGGIGWIEVSMNYDRDPINGDIALSTVSPFDILIDPHFKKGDLSDCDYIIRHQKVNKDKLMEMFPEKAEDIKALKGGDYKNTSPRQEPSIPSDRKEKLLVVEYWHRVLEKVKFAIDVANPSEVYPIDDNKFIELQGNPAVKIIERKVPRIKLTTVLDKRVVVYDGPGPGCTSNYPFIPFFCYHESSFGDLKLSISGVIRSLKDPQREKNKRRSNIMMAINSMPHSGFFVPKGSVDNIKTLTNAGGAGKMIEYNQVKGRPEPIPPPDIPASLMQLEMAFNEDIRTIGANPDLLGQQYGKNDPGITIQLRQKQGLTSLQEIFDSLSFSTRMLGRRIIELIGTNFSNEKIKRIVGATLPWDIMRKQLQAEAQQIQGALGSMKMPTTDGLVPEDEEDQMMLQQIETEKINTQTQAMEMQNRMMQLQQEWARVEQDERAFWMSFDDIRKTARFDCVVDEVVNNPTTRVANLLSLTQAAQYGVPIPPEAIIELMDIPKGTKEKLNSYIAEQKANMAMMEQQKNSPPSPPEMGN